MAEYTPYTWADGEDGATPITAARLNHIEKGIEAKAEKGADGTDGTDGTDAVLPATATAEELEAGTETEPRMISPKLVHDEIARQVAASAA